MTRICFVVFGKPQTAGSKRAFPFRRKNGLLGVAVSDDNPKSRDWKNAVSDAGANQGLDGLLSGPLKLTLTFYAPRPKGHSGKKGLKATAPAYPITRPDVLKLARAVEDALTGVVWGDDSQVVNEVLFKRYGEPARVEIEIEGMVEDGSD